MYDRMACVRYARQWAFSFNPQYYDFSALGGDCTNFVSQCIHAGGIPMNYTRYGWFYRNLNDRAPAWSGVEEFWRFGVANRGEGVRLLPCDRLSLRPGDVVQLGNDDGFYHTLLVTRIVAAAPSPLLYVSAHDRAVFDAPLDGYTYSAARYAVVDG